MEKTNEILVSRKIVIATMLFTISLLSTTLAQNKFSISTSLSIIGGSFSDNSHRSSYYLYGGVRYQAQDYYLSLNLPLVFNSSGSFTQVGGMYIPNDDTNNNVDEGMQSSSNHGSMMTGGHEMFPGNVGIGDLYLYGSYNILDEKSFLPGFSTNGYVKFPTAAASLGIGTGKFDYSLSMSLYKFIKTFSLYLQVGYLFLGKPDNSEIENPIVLSFGIGNSFGNGKHLLLLGYDSYSTIQYGYTSPEQISLGYTYFINSNYSIFLISSIGLNSSTSDYTLSAGINFNI